MSDEPWDADRIAAECAATAREKSRKTTRRKKGAPPAPPITGEPHDGDAPMRDPEAFRDAETGRMLPGHPGLPGVGRPKGTDTYEPKYADWVRKWGEAGALVSEMIEWLGISNSTFYRWRSEHPEFLEAAKAGHGPADDRAVRSLFERANGYDYTEEVPVKMRDGETDWIKIVTVRKHMPPDTRALSYWLGNRRQKDWTDRRSVEHSGQIEHVNPDQARRELEEWLANGAVIEGTAVEVTPALAAPMPVEEPEADDF